MLKSELNLMVIQNFILHITHDSEGDNSNNPHTFTANELYQMAADYIEKDHVDGKEGDDEDANLSSWRSSPAFNSAVEELNKKDIGYLNWSDADIFKWQLKNQKK